MNKLGSFLNPLLIVSLILVNDASSEQVRTFILEQDDIYLQFRVSLEKDSFYLLENISLNVIVKNISNRLFLGSAIRSPEWIIEHESGTTYRYRDAPIVLDSARLSPRSFIKKSVSLERINFDQVEHYQNFPLGKYQVFYGPDTTPFVFRIIDKPNSKGHYRRAKFVEFCETHHPGKFFFDSTWGIPTHLEVFGGGDLAKGVVYTNLTEKAYKFFGLNKSMFGITNPRSELKVYKVIRGNIETEVNFKQFYKGLETSKDYIILTRFTPEGKLKFVYGTFYPDINLSTIPRISKSKALETAKHDLDPQGTGPYRNPGSPSLMVFPYKGNYYLAWFIFVNQWRYLIDANNGNIIHKEWIHPSCIVQ